MSFLTAIKTRISRRLRQRFVDSSFGENYQGSEKDLRLLSPMTGNIYCLRRYREFLAGSTFEDPIKYEVDKDGVDWAAVKRIIV